MERNLSANAAGKRRACAGCLLCKPMAAWYTDARKTRSARLAQRDLRSNERYRFYVS